MPVYSELRACPHCAKQFSPSSLPQSKRSHVVHCRKNPCRLRHECQKCRISLSDTSALRRHLNSRRHREDAAPATPPSPINHDADQRTGYQLILTDPAADTHAQLAELDVAQMADPKGCALMCWTDGERVPESLRLMKEWGFEYQTVFLNWVHNAANQRRGLRVRMGQGRYTKPGSRLLLLGRRGNVARLQRPKAKVAQVLVAPPDAHAPAFDAIDRYFDAERTQKRLIVGREQQVGWENASV